MGASLICPQISYAYPVFAQQAYESPREATGRIVCANCHLAQKPTEVEVPQAVLPDSVFEAYVKELLTTVGDQFSKEEIKMTWKEAPIEGGKLDYVKFVQFIKRGKEEEA